MPPGYIIENWTDELLTLMCDKLSERKRREMEAVQNPRNKTVSDRELFACGSNMIKVVEGGN